MPTKIRRARFTDKMVEKIRPEAGRRVIVWGAHGLGLRVSPGGGKAWIYAYRFDGKPRMLTLGACPPMDVEGARAAHLQAYELRRKNVDPCVALAGTRRENQEAVTVAEVAAQFLELYVRPTRRKKTADEYSRIVQKEILPTLGARAARDLTRREVLALMDGIAIRRASPVMAARVLAVLRKMFAWGVEREIVASSPAVGVRSPDPRRMRDRVLTLEELGAVVRGLNATPARKAGAQVRLCLLLILATGTRANEAAGAAWAEVDLEARWWTIPASRTKNGALLRLPLSDFAVRILQEAREAASRSPWVFPAKGQRIDAPRGPMRAEALYQAIQRLAPDWGFGDGEGAWGRFSTHDIRRSVATCLSAAGTAPRVVDRVLNHLPPKLQRTYDRHSYDEEARLALGEWGRTLEALAIQDVGQ